MTSRKQASDTPGDAGASAEEPSYVVADGQSLTSTRGILGPGTPVTASDFGAGDARLTELRDAGVVVPG